MYFPLKYHKMKAKVHKQDKSTRKNVTNIYEHKQNAAMLAPAYISRTRKMGAEESEVPHNEFQVNLGYKDREDRKKEKKHSGNKIHSFCTIILPLLHLFFFNLPCTLLSKPNELFSLPTVLEFRLL